MKFHSIFTLLLTVKAQLNPPTSISNTTPRQIIHLKEVAATANEFMDNPEKFLEKFPGVQLNRNFRDLGSIVKSSSNTAYIQYLNYGCWCNFESGKIGHGRPVDYSDSTCKQLWENYHCVDEEANAAGETCDSSKDYYKSYMVYVYAGTASGMKAVGLMQLANDFLNDAYDRCEELNTPSICKVGACKSEVRWAYEIILEGLFEKNSPPENANVINYHTERFYSNEYINYDQQGLCSNNGQNGNKILECCGIVPSHKRFNAVNKGCCAKVLYDPQMSTCTDGNINGLFM